ncbi:MAG: hypothetical protein EDM05_000410 (plasmid) [Leptolyngbya sp. IPPAS B-1204]
MGVSYGGLGGLVDAALMERVNVREGTRQVLEAHQGSRDSQNGVLPLIGVYATRGGLWTSPSATAKTFLSLRFN